MDNYTNSNTKFLRESKKISQEKIAKDLKIDQSTLAKWESNSRKITLEWALKLAYYFNVNIGDFISIDLAHSKLNNSTLIPEVKDYG